jgi:aminoglycoside phosphotransferase (APT) family kinase protein
MDEAVLAAVVRRYDPALRLLRAAPLEGGVSASVVVLEVTDGGPPRRFVLRRHGPNDLAGNPQVARHEYRLLQALRAAGQPVPEPLLLDTAGDLLPTPYLLQSFVPGDGVLPADPGPALAERLAAIHALPVAGLGFLSRRADQVEGLLGKPLADPALERIRLAARARWPGPVVADRLLHGDFWPGNVIWDRGRVAAVIDWEDAALGDPRADLGHARVELLWSHGPGVVESFSRRYRALAGTAEADLRLWDLVALLDKVPRIGGWGLPPAREAAMRMAGLGFGEAALG